MKRGLLLLCAVFLLTLAFQVDATTLNFGTALQGQYNLGDSIHVDGKITVDKATAGSFKLQIVCNNQATAIVKSKQLNLAADQQHVFTEQMMLPLGVEGTCVVDGTFDNVDVDSPSFTIIRDLRGFFDITDTGLQLGESFILKGRVTKLDNTPLEGVATITLTNEQQVVDVQNVEVSDGEFNFSYRAENIPAGRYDVDVQALDAFGNQKIFQRVAGFEVYNELKISALLDKQQVLPGESIQITGNVKYRNGKMVDDLVKLRLNGNEVFLKKGEFTFEFRTMSNAKSGENSLMFAASDGYGNLGEGLMSFRVTPVPSKLVIEKNKQEFFPREIVEVRSKLYDQAGEEMQNAAVLKMKDPNGNVVEQSIADIVYTLDAFAEPGIWEITAEEQSLSVYDRVVVKELTNVSVRVSGQDVVVRNIGNVPFEAGVSVKVDNEIYNQNMELGVNASGVIELDQFAGTHDVLVLAAGKEYPLGQMVIEDRRGFFGKIGDQLTGNVVSEGETEKASNPWVYIAVVAVLLGFLGGFYFYKKRNERFYEGRRSRERKEAASYAERIRSSREKVQPKRRYPGRPIDEEDAREFRERMMGRLNEDSSRDASRDAGRERGRREF